MYNKGENTSPALHRIWNHMFSVCANNTELTEITAGLLNNRTDCDIKAQMTVMLRPKRVANETTEVGWDSFALSITASSTRSLYLHHLHSE